MSHLQQINPELYRELSRLQGEALRRLKGLADKVPVMQATKPVAYDSPDYYSPVGTLGQSSSDAFNLALLRWLPVETLSILDLGCAGGAMVGDFYDLGCLAVGVEGTDHQKKAKSGLWGRLPDNLLTADISRPFQIHLRSGAVHEPAKFQVVTAWEVLEHIKADNLPQVMENIDRHLAKDGVLIMSICPISDQVDGVEMHQTIQPQEWWVDLFSRLGYRAHPEVVTYFGRAVVRGGDLEPDSSSFLIALTRAGDSLPFPERLGRQEVDSRPLGISREEYEVTYWRVVDLMNRVTDLEKKLGK